MKKSTKFVFTVTICVIVACLLVYGGLVFLGYQYKRSIPQKTPDQRTIPISSQNQPANNNNNERAKYIMELMKKSGADVDKFYSTLIDRFVEHETEYKELATRIKTYYKDLIGKTGEDENLSMDSNLNEQLWMLLDNILCRVGKTITSLDTKILKDINDNLDSILEQSLGWQPYLLAEINIGRFNLAEIRYLVAAYSLPILNTGQTCYINTLRILLLDSGDCKRVATLDAKTRDMISLHLRRLSRTYYYSNAADVAYLHLYSVLEKSSLVLLDLFFGDAFGAGRPISLVYDGHSIACKNPKCSSK